MLQEWNAFWGTQWKAWFDALASAPNPWLPALAAGRPDQPAAIDFFLPWLPRVEAFVTPLDPSGEDQEAVRVMLRAALPHVGSGEQQDWLNVDATVSRSLRTTATPPAEPVSPELLADLPTAASALPLIEAQATATDAAGDASPGAAKVVKTKTEAPKRRTRKAAAPKTKAEPPSSAE